MRRKGRSQRRPVSDKRRVSNRLRGSGWSARDAGTVLVALALLIFTVAFLPLFVLGEWLFPH